MKLNKKRISILVSVLMLLVLLIFVLCSFDFPTYGSILSFPNGISLTDQSTLVTIFNLQELCGSFNSVVPVFCYKSDGYIILFATYKGYGYTFNTQPDAANFSISSNNVFLRFYFSEGGFSYSGTASYSASAPKSDVLFYRTSLTSDIVSNTLFSGTSNPLDSRINSVLSYWYNFYRQLLLDLQIEVESAYDDGYGDGYSDGFDTGFDSGYFDGLESGLVWGEELGYQEGYTEGYQEGIGTGYRDGYLAGEAEGYDTGYADGYQDGYDTGYSDGLEDAPPETVTIVIYEDPVEIDVPGIISSVSSIPDSILSGSFDFEFAGINIYGLLKLLIIVFIISAVIFFIIKRSA